MVENSQFKGFLNLCRTRVYDKKKGWTWLGFTQPTHLKVSWIGLEEMESDLNVLETQEILHIQKLGQNTEISQKIASPSLYYITNMSVTSGSFTKFLIFVRIIHLFKVDNPNQTGNHRPISNLPLFNTF